MRRLLAHAIDYAGMFPPARLTLADAAANYSAYLATPQAWALGRFLLPASQAEALETAGGRRDWRIGLVGRPATAPPFAIEAIEAPVTHAGDIAALQTAAPQARCYCEVDLNGSWRELLPSIQQAGARAKIRTGGATTPTVPELTEFLSACVGLELPFKATAGLHHAVRAGVTHGFLNLAVATALLLAGATRAEAERALSATSLDQLDLGLAGSARRLWDGFGSCSFEEPMHDIAALVGSA